MNESGLSRIVGEELTQVWFVMDDIQLIFGAADSLQCLVWPRVELRDQVLRIVDPGFRDALCGFLMTDVVAVEERIGLGLIIEFAGGKIVLAPTRDELVDPEIALFHELFEPDTPMDIWEPGDAVFAHLA